MAGWIDGKISRWMGWGRRDEWVDGGKGGWMDEWLEKG